MVKPMKLRLAEADRARYGGDEWLTFDYGTFTDVPLSALLRMEAVALDQLGAKLIELVRGPLPEHVDLRATKTIAVVVWLALKANNPDAPEFVDFDPLLWQVDMKDIPAPAGGADADPPAASSTGTSVETPPALAAPRASRSRRGSGR
ncbi:hypothetical protein [Catellatospora sp. NPDC049609]|uniref:hypothetical protein n=1 Tax=Catellatospora sp. NPDC049609 TaxID=3155505 RepID=UPI003432EB70